MKMPFTCALLLLFAARFGFGANDPAGEVLRVVGFNYYGTKYESTVLKGDLAQSPIWADKEENPPLGPKRAIAKAHEYLMARVGKDSKWGVDRVCLEPIGGRDQWIYIVEMRRFPAGRDFEGPTSSWKVVVLLNGSVIPMKQVTPPPKVNE